MEDFDYVIVGGGSAGCVLAGKLSEDRTKRVLLIEAGGSDRRFWIRTPLGYGKTFFNPAVNWKYTTQPDPGLDGEEAYWPRGKVIGGSSSINAMVYARGLPTDFDDWRDAGNPGWGWDDVGPVFRAVEHRVLPDGRVEGTGPLSVSYREPEYHPLKRFFYAAAREIGLPSTDDMNGVRPEGVAAYAITTKNGLRCSAADAFLHPAMGKSNLVVRTQALATRIVVENRRASGIEYRWNGGSNRANARREVIVAAGAVNAPQLLQLSGIGPGAVLKAAGIGVLHDNPNVGGNLQDHLAVSYFYRATEPTLNQYLGSWSGRLRAGLRYLATRGGPLSLSVNQMGGLVRTRPDAPRPDCQLYFSPASYTISTPGKRQLFKPDPFPGFLLSFNPCRPTSTGRIDIVSPDPTIPPAIRPNSLSTNKDLDDVVAGARLIRALRNTAAMRALIEAPHGFDVADADDEAVVADFRKRAGTVYHPTCTCRMAPEALGGVVDHRLRVHGVEGLRVADASVFPNVTSANTNAPTIMLAFKAAAMIADDNRSRS